MAMGSGRAGETPWWTDDSGTPPARPLPPATQNPLAASQQGATGHLLRPCLQEPGGGCRTWTGFRSDLAPVSGSLCCVTLGRSFLLWKRAVGERPGPHVQRAGPRAARGGRLAGGFPSGQKEGLITGVSGRDTEERWVGRAPRERRKEVGGASGSPLLASRCVRKDAEGGLGARPRPHVALDCF